MGVRVRDAGVWKTVLNTDPTKALWVRDGGSWKMVATLWYRDAGVWIHDPNYLIPTSAPTNFRVTSTSTDYSGVNLAWDWSGGPTPHNFVVKIYDYGGNSASVPDTAEVTLDSSARTYRASLASGTYSKFDLFAVSAPDNVRVAAAAQPKWKVGAAAYTVYDVPIYGWADTWEWTPPLAFESSNYGSANSGSHAVDNNISSSWISSAHAQTGTVNDWEGIWVRMPYWAHHKYVGMHLIQETGGLPACWLTHGVYYSNAWQGSVNQPVASPPCHPYMVHPNISYYSVERDQYLYEGDYVTDGGSNPGGNLVSITLGPNLKTSAYVFGYYASILEVRLLLQNYRVVSYGPRTVAAVPSAAW